MSVFDPPPPPRPPLHAEHPALRQLRTVAARLRRRLAAVNTVTLLMFVSLGVVLHDDLGSRVAGWFTLGMVLLGCQVFVALVSVVWYDRACSARCDPYVDELRHAVGTFGAREARQ